MCERKEGTAAAYRIVPDPSWGELVAGEVAGILLLAGFCLVKASLELMGAP